MAASWALQQRYGSLPVLLRHRQVDRQPVAHDRHQHQPGAEGGGPRALHLRPGDRDHAGEADQQPHRLGAAQRPAQQHHRPGGPEQRHRAVEHARHRRVDPLLRDREQQQRQARPDQPEERHPRQVRAVDRAARRREQRQRRHAQPEPRERDDPGPERLKADVDEQERRPPDDRDARQQQPLLGAERLGAAAAAGLEQAPTHAAGSPPPPSWRAG